MFWFLKVVRARQDGINVKNVIHFANKLYSQTLAVLGIKVWNRKVGKLWQLVQGNYVFVAIL